MKHRPPGTQNVAAHTATVHDMLLQWANPAQIDRKANTPIDPRENQSFTIKGDVWAAKIEANDCDIHLELSAPGQGQDADRVIVEVPQDPAFAQARNQILQALIRQGEGDLNRKKNISLNQAIPIEVTGLAFFDAFHYSAANPKRGHGHGGALVGTLWELHPVVQLSVLTPVLPPGNRTLVAQEDGLPAEGSQSGNAADVQSDSQVGQEHFAFAVSADFLKSLETGRTILPTFSVKLGGHSKIHPLASDCEMHVAASLQSQTFGSPNDLVIEPPNLCKIDPNGDESDEVDAWLSVFDDLQGQTCHASGFPRIFTEHATGGSGASNPDHVLELHPVVSIDCGSDKRSFANFVKLFPGMRAISPKTAASCIANRSLQVEYDQAKDRYLFHESGGTCGNFAEISVESIIAGTVRTIPGGHSAIARVTADGETSSELKIYTLAGSEIDSWLGNNPTAIGLHGLITYDYFAFIKTLHSPGGDWKKPASWTPVPFPLAFVVFGERAGQATPSSEPE